MVSRIRKRITYANVALTVALVFAMTGGAYAAGKYLITSTKQIKPSVLASLKGAKGAAGAQGSAGPAGPAGAAGPQGPAGLAGKEGTNGTSGTNGTNGESVTSKEVKSGESSCAKLGGSSFTVAGKTDYACNGSPWTVGGTLPVGKSETGQWDIAQDVPRTESLEFMATGISFPVPLASALSVEQVHYIGLEEGEKEAQEAVAIKEGKCKGNFEKPEAASGNLCVFTSNSANYGQKAREAFPFELNNAETTEPGAGRSGALLTASVSPKPGFVDVYGDWVVTG